MMFVVDNQCTMCGNSLKTRKHWCDELQIILALILIQHKYAGGNIHTSILRKNLSHLKMSDSRITNTIVLLKGGINAEGGYVKHKADLSDPRKRLIWINERGLNLLDKKLEQYSQLQQEPPKLNEIIAELAVIPT